MSLARQIDPGPWMTADQFKLWPGEPGIRQHQLIDGERMAMAPASLTHGRLHARLGRMIGNHLATHRPDCEVVMEPGVQPRIDPAHNVRVPDLAVGFGLGATHYLTDPLLIVEILSPSNARETREAVRACLTIPSLAEVLILSATAIAAEVYRRDDAAIWLSEPLRFGPGDSLALASLGFACTMEDLYAGLGLG